MVTREKMYRVWKIADEQTVRDPIDDKYWELMWRGKQLLTVEQWGEISILPELLQAKVLGLREWA